MRAIAKNRTTINKILRFMSQRYAVFRKKPARSFENSAIKVSFHLKRDKDRVFVTADYAIGTKYRIARIIATLARKF